MDGADLIGLRLIVRKRAIRFMRRYLCARDCLYPSRAIYVVQHILQLARLLTVRSTAWTYTLARSSFVDRRRRCW
jgi:hypothetical protein